VYNVASSILGVNCSVGGSLLKKKKQTIRNFYLNIWSLFTLTTSGIFAFFLARQPQVVLLDRFPPFKPCANEFSLPFSNTKTLARP
jgi:hypothetical protein